MPPGAHREDPLLVKFNIVRTLRRSLSVLLVISAGHAASAQNITLYPAGDTVALIGSCTPPAFRWTVTSVSPSLDRIVIRPYWSDMGIGVPPDHLIERLDSVTFEIRDSVPQNNYRVRYTDHSRYYPRECFVPADSEFWTAPCAFELTLMVFEDTCVVDSATMPFLGYQFGLAVESEVPLLPAYLRLEQNYPNPFNGSTVVTFRLPGAGRVRLEVFDIAGRSVQTLANEYRSAGVHTIRWEPRALPSGSYFLRLSDGMSQSVLRCCLLR